MEIHRQRRPVRRGQGNLTIDTRGLAASVMLRHPPHAVKRVRSVRSINFCRLRTFLRFPSCDALKILRRKHRTSSSTDRHEAVSQSSSSSCGPFTSRVPNLPTCTDAANVPSSKTHPAHVSTLSDPGKARYPASNATPPPKGMR